MSQNAKSSGVIGSPYAVGLSGTSYGQISIDSLNSRHEFDDGLDIRLTPAAGGFVVSIFHRNSGNKPSLHLTMCYLKKA
jgi:hypothetical protein